MPLDKYDFFLSKSLFLKTRELKITTTSLVGKLISTGLEMLSKKNLQFALKLLVFPIPKRQQHTITK